MSLDNGGGAIAPANAQSEEITATLSVEAEGWSRLRGTREALRIVAEAEAFFEANLSRPVYTADLCATLHVSPRRLHDAFRATWGISPHAYLKSRRLHLVHHALMSGRPGSDLVKSIALDHGFWHLGRFAHDYRTIFGKLPAETLAARGEADGAARSACAAVRAGP